MIGPKFSEQVEYLFNYAWDDLSIWGSNKFFGSPARSVASLYGVFLVVAVVLILKAPQRDGE